MIFAAIFLIAFGLLMILKPQLIWAISESWKSSGASGPTLFYRLSVRIGGILCTLAGIAAGVVHFLR